MFGNCCNTCCPADSNRGLFGICLNDATLVIILLAIWLLSSGGLSGYGGGCGCNTCGGGRSGCGDCGCGARVCVPQAQVISGPCQTA